MSHQVTYDLLHLYFIFNTPMLLSRYLKGAGLHQGGHPERQSAPPSEGRRRPRVMILNSRLLAHEVEPAAVENRLLPLYSHRDLYVGSWDCIAI